MLIKSAPLYPYQARVNRFTATKSRIGLFVYFGGGKTYLSLEWVASLCENNCNPFPILVLANKTLTKQWQLQIEKFTELVSIVVRGTAQQRLKKLAQTAAVYIINYDAVRSALVHQALILKGFRTIIADESTQLKESRTKRFQLLYKGFVRRIPYRAILTGNPATEDPVNLFSQLMFLDDGFLFEYIPYI